MEFYKKYAIALNLIGLIFGAVFTLLSTIGIFFPEEDFVKNSDPLTEFFKVLGNYIYWLFMIALGILLICAWLFGDIILSKKKFDKLIVINSKAIFVRNQNEIEELAWKLGPKFVDLVIEKKKEFKIKR